MTNGGFIDDADDDLIVDPSNSSQSSGAQPPPPTSTSSYSAAPSASAQGPATTSPPRSNDPAVIRPNLGDEFSYLFKQPRSKQNPYKGVKRFLVFASGARPEILAQCPTDEATHVGLGGTVIATAGLSAISMFFALHSALHLSAFNALVGGFLWALIIFNLDRWLIVSQKRMDSKRKQWINVIPRVVVALLLGIVISEPLLHQLFRPELDREVSVLQAEDTQTALDELQNGKLQRAIDDNIQQIAALQNSAGGVIGDEAKLQTDIDKLKAEIATTQEAVYVAEKKLNDEQMGLSKSENPGCGPICNQLKLELDQKNAKLVEVKQANDPLIAQFQSEQTELRSKNTAAREAAIAEGAKQREILIANNERLQDQRAQRRDAILNQNGTGLLNDIRALNSLGEKQISINIAHILIVLMFFALDTLPVVGKTLLLTGSKRPYEKLCDAVDERTELEAQQLVSDAVFENQHREMVLRADANLRSQVEMDNNEYFVKVAGDTQRQVGEMLLDKWREDELSRVKSEIDKNPPKSI